MAKYSKITPLGDNVVKFSKKIFMEKSYQFYPF
jgi:hypothetical protein